MGIIRPLEDLIPEDEREDSINKPSLFDGHLYQAGRSTGKSPDTGV
jgi:hypothetical protein